MEAATARTAPAARPAPRRKPRGKPAPSKRRKRSASSSTGTRRTSARSVQAPAGRLIPHMTGRASASPAARPRILAGAALFPQAAMRSAGAVRDFSDSSLIHRLTRGRSWIAVLCVLLGGIVALNVLSLSLTAGSGQRSLQIDELKTKISSLQAQIEEKLSAGKVEAEATRLGLDNPNPDLITFLRAKQANAQRVAHLLATDGFLFAPSQPSSYPEPGASYAPVPTDAPVTTTTTETTTAAPITTTPSSTATADPSTSTGTGTSTGSGTSSGSGTSTSSGSSSGASTGTTGGVGL